MEQKIRKISNFSTKNCQFLRRLKSLFIAWTCFHKESAKTEFKKKACDKVMVRFAKDSVLLLIASNAERYWLSSCKSELYAGLWKGN